MAVDHFYLDAVRIFHCIYSATRNHVDSIVKYASLDEDVFGFAYCVIFQFWHPVSILYEANFANIRKIEKSNSMLCLNDIIELIHLK